MPEMLNFRLEEDAALDIFNKAMQLRETYNFEDNIHDFYCDSAQLLLSSLVTLKLKKKYNEYGILKYESISGFSVHFSAESLVLLYLSVVDEHLMNVSQYKEDERAKSFTLARIKEPYVPVYEYVRNNNVSDKKDPYSKLLRSCNLCSYNISQKNFIAINWVMKIIKDIYVVPEVLVETINNRSVNEEVGKIIEILKNFR